VDDAIRPVFLVRNLVPDHRGNPEFLDLPLLEVDALTKNHCYLCDMEAFGKIFMKCWYFDFGGRKSFFDVDYPKF